MVLVGPLRQLKVCRGLEMDLDPCLTELFRLLIWMNYHPNTRIQVLCEVLYHTFLLITMHLHMRQRHHHTLCVMRNLYSRSLSGVTTGLIPVLLIYVSSTDALRGHTIPRISSRTSNIHIILISDFIHLNVMFALIPPAWYQASFGNRRACLVTQQYRPSYGYAERYSTRILLAVRRQIIRLTGL